MISSKAVLEDYHSLSVINKEMETMGKEREEMDKGNLSDRSLIEHCVKNRHFRFLFLKKEKEADFVNAIVDRLTDIDILHREYGDFEHLHKTVEDAIGNIKGIGGLMLYDIARMIGYALRPVIVPQARVYLNRGAKEGAKHLLKLDRIGKFLPIESFTEFFPNTESQYIEDILCIYKEDFKSGVFHPKAKGCAGKKETTDKGCCLAR